MTPDLMPVASHQVPKIIVLVLSQKETYWDLLIDKAHLGVEITVSLIENALTVGLTWLAARKHILHHLARDRKEGLR